MGNLGETVDFRFLRRAARVPLDNSAMFLKAGAISLALLLASRVLGLVRESAQAAAFGASGLGDLVVLMLALPDWFAGVLASGALAYVLVPTWAGHSRATIDASQRRLACALLGAGAVLAALLFFGRETAVAWLAGGILPASRPAAAAALAWSAVAMPAAFLASLWATRLQHERDFAGLYGANLVVNLSLIGAIALAAGSGFAVDAVSLIGAGLLAAMALRLAWLAWRQRIAHRAANTEGIAATALGPLRVPVWLWAILVSGLPLTLPFAARSMASQAGEGAIASFNFAWKLVELPLLLAVQLVATLAFPTIAAALAARDAQAPARSAAAIGGAFALAWTLACAAAAALVAGAPALARVLFGWGRMDASAIDAIASWAATGAWGLLPQALTAVVLTVLASQGRLRAVAVAYALSLAVLLACGAWGLNDGHGLMRLLNLLYLFVALVALAAAGPTVLRMMPASALLPALGCLLAVAAASLALPSVAVAALPVALAVPVAAGGLVVLLTWLSSRTLREALRR